MNSARILRWAAVLGLAFPTLYAFALRLLFLRILARQRAGDIGPLLARLAPDVHFVFPGESSWAADLHGREAVEGWERRFLAVGLELEPREVLVSGPPWNTKIALHFDDHLVSETGELVYENRGVIFGTATWGKLKDFVVYEDTQKLGPLDEYLERSGVAA